MNHEPVSPQPKPRPRALEIEAKRAARETLDKKESAKARTRAQGRCEVRIVNASISLQTSLRMVLGGGCACMHRDTETHHLKGGIGRRGRGNSALAIWKLRCCQQCHQLITGRVLVPVDARANAEQIVYRRAR